MANVQDAVTAIQGLQTNVTDYFGKVLNAFNRLEAKIAELQAQVVAGSETQPIIDVINTMNTDLEVKKAEADIAGT